MARGVKRMRSSQRSGPSAVDRLAGAVEHAAEQAWPGARFETLPLGITRAPGVTPSSSSVATSNSEPPEKPTTSVSAVRPS